MPAAVPFDTNQEAIAFNGVCTIGDGRQSFGDFNQYDTLGNVLLPWKDLVERALTRSRHVVVMEGTYVSTTGAPTVSFPYSKVELHPNAVIECSGSAAVVGLIVASGSTGVHVSGGRFSVADYVASQIVIHFDNANFARLENTVVTHSHLISLGDTATPMVSIKASGCFGFEATRCRVHPSNGVIGFFDAACVGATWDRCRWTIQAEIATPTAPTPIVHGYKGFYAENNQFTKLLNFQGYGVGSNTAEVFQDGGLFADDGSVRQEAVIHFKGTTGEDGHSIIENPEMELCAAKHGILIEGCQGWLEIIEPRIGLANNGAFKDGDAAIKITRNAVATRNSRAISIRGGRVHNYGLHQLGSKVIYALARGVMMPPASVPVTFGTAASVSATAATSTFELASGTWGVIPVAGEYIQTSGFANVENNGFFLVVSATEDTVEIDPLLIPGGTLVDEAAGANELISGLTGFHSAALWIEHATDVDIDGLKISNQRHAWGVVIDTTTVRGVCLDNMTFHRANASLPSDNGAIAPIRLVTGTLANTTTEPNDAEGVSIGIVKLKSWGATPVVFSNGTWSYAGTTFTAVAPTITETSAPFQPNGITDAATNYDKPGAAVATDDLSLIRRLS